MDAGTQMSTTQVFMVQEWRRPEHLLSGEIRRKWWAQTQQQATGLRGKGGQHPREVKNKPEQRAPGENGLISTAGGCRGRAWWMVSGHLAEFPLDDSEAPRQ